MGKSGKVAKPIVFLAVLLVVSCSKKENPTVSEGSAKPPAPERQTIGGQEVVIRGTIELAGATASIEVNDNFFKPNILRSVAGSKVTLELNNKGAALHNFSVPEQVIDRDLPPGSQAFISVTLPTSGRLPFFCKYHRDESGMIGALEAR